MLNNLKRLNPEIDFYSVEDPEFSSFGRILTGFDTKEILSVASKIELPENGSAYQPEVGMFGCLDIAKEITDRQFGTLPAQIGFCWGHSNFLNATEWHTSNEVNIATTPLVLILGHVWDIKDGKISSSKFTAFYVPMGTVLEIYSSTLHFCPCEVQKEGFGCVVALPIGTNTDLEVSPEDPLLFRKNKWILSHEENIALQKRGVVSGIHGINYKIKYEQ